METNELAELRFRASRLEAEVDALRRQMRRLEETMRAVQSALPLAEDPPDCYRDPS